MSEQTVNIRIPDPLELQQYRIQVGDTVQFIEKMTGTQDDLDAFSGQLNLTVADMQSAADQIAARYTQILQTGQQVADDKTAVQQLRTETALERQAAEQAATTAGQHLTATAQERQGAEQAATTAGQHLTATTQQRQLAEQAATTAGQHLTATAQERQGAEQAAVLAGQAAQQAAQSAIEAGPTNLGSTRTATTVTVTSSTGNNASLAAATASLAGVMRASDKQKLDSVAPVPEGATYTEFVSSGTFTKDPAAKFVYVECVGGGGSGALGITNDTAYGGCGGRYSSRILRAADLPSSVAVTVGLGGGAVSASITSGGRSGNNGGDSTFGDYCIGYGGQGGPFVTTQYNNSILYGPVAGAGAKLVTTLANSIANARAMYYPTSNNSSHSAVALTDSFGEFQGFPGSQLNLFVNLPASPVIKDTVFGGGGGGSFYSTSSQSAVVAGGMSKNHGNGGNSGYVQSNSRQRAATAGSFPGGGGGGDGHFNATSTVALTSGAGGNGVVRVWQW